MNKDTTKLEEARKLLFAVQPFCEAWGAFDLADDIKDYLDGKSKIPRDDQKPAGGALPAEHKGGEKDGREPGPQVDGSTEAGSVQAEDRKA